MSIFSGLRGVTGKVVVALVLLSAAVPLAVSPADARAGGGMSFGSRGGRTFSMPSATPTAPRYSQPFQRSETPAYQTAQPRRGWGFGTGLLAGLLGAGLMGSMFGGGFFGGIAALFGLMVKLALIGGLIWLVLRLIRGRRPALATGMGSARSPLGGLPGGGGSGMGGFAAGAQGPRGTPASVAPGDYAAFEQTLQAVQAAYSHEDVGTLSRLATPEMVRGFAADLEENRRRGQRNDISGTRLLQGDVSEAWAEGPVTYATVAMRFAAVDVMLDRASNRVVEGDAVHPVEATELWTFRRERNGAWVLSAIQQGG